MMMDLAKLPRRFASASVVGTPLWPAGHLPLKGGDPITADALPQEDDCSLRQAIAGQEAWRRCVLPISPLEGEMPGRAEGGIR